MDADVRDQRDGEISSGEPRHQRHTSDHGDYLPAAAAAAGAAAVVGDSDSAGSFRHAQHHPGQRPFEQPLPANLRMQQQAYGGDVGLHHGLLDLHHASSFASSLGNPAGQNLAALAAAQAATAAAAAATETTGTSKDDVSEEERVRRRREINRNSQKRIRERRNKEMDGLKYEAQRLAADNESLLRQVEGLTLEKADMLRQIQDLTEKWQQSIAENAWLNRENIQLRNSLTNLQNIVGAAAAAAGPGAPPPGTPSLTGAGSGPVAAAAAAAAGARGSSGSGGAETGEGLPPLGLGVAGLNLPPLHGLGSKHVSTKASAQQF